MNKDKQNLEDQLQLWRQNKKKENLKYVLLSAAGILSVLVIWQLAVVLGLVNERLLPAPTRILNTLIFKINNKAPDGNMLGVNIMASLQVALSGFLAAIVIGVPLGLLMGWWTYADRFIRPIFELIRPVPPIASGCCMDGSRIKGKSVNYFFYSICSLRY